MSTMFVTLTNGGTNQKGRSHVSHDGHGKSLSRPHNGSKLAFRESNLTSNGNLEVTRSNINIEFIII